MNMKWCDLNCVYASFPEEKGVDGSESCRTFQALYCEKLSRLVFKNDRCRVEAEEDEQE
jgi:hypothetical protein